MNTRPNIPDPDDFFAALMALHAGLSPEASRRLDARIVLLLANQIGDPAVLAGVLDAAGRGLDAGSADRPRWFEPGAG